MVMKTKLKSQKEILIEGFSHSLHHDLLDSINKFISDNRNELEYLGPYDTGEILGSGVISFLNSFAKNLSSHSSHNNLSDIKLNIIRKLLIDEE